MHRCEFSKDMGDPRAGKNEMNARRDLGVEFISEDMGIIWGEEIQRSQEIG